MGGGGFIGGHLAKRLKSEGNFVKIADIKNHEFFPHDLICDEFIKCDLTDPLMVSDVIFDDCDELYQLAADMGGAGYIFTGENDANVMHNSATINLNVANECVKKKVKKVFYSSSACMYPEHNQLDPNNPNCLESSAYPANPDSEYGWEKLFSERLFLAFNRNYNLNVRIARFHNIFGPQGTWVGGKEKAPAAMIRKVCEASNDGEIEVWGDGEQTRNFSDIDDCLYCLDQLITNKDILSQTFNIGPDEESITINELYKMLCNKLQFNEPAEYVKDRPNEVKHAICSSDKARKYLDYKTSVNLNDAIDKVINYIKIKGPKNFEYNYDLEINNEYTPKTWKDKQF